MAVRITQIEIAEHDLLVLHVAGKLFVIDAELLEETFTALRKKDKRRIEIDLSEISFLDGNSVAILIRLKNEGAALKGINYFVQKMIEAFESPSVEEQ